MKTQIKSDTCCLRQGNTNFKCNFDEDFCQFSNDPSGALEWDRQQGPTFTDDTGPESDHTTGDPDGGKSSNKTLSELNIKKIKSSLYFWYYAEV